MVYPFALTGDLPGHWGAVTSSVDWCERNYALSPLVAELFNTLSSLAMVAVGVVGLALHRRVLERRFLAAFALLALVGLGSAAFHASLRFELQMLDELPMLYLVILMVYVLVERGPRRRFGAGFPALLIAYAVLVTFLNARTRGPLQFWVFQLSFGSLELYCLASVWALQRRASAPAVRRLFRLGMGAYALAILLWFTDVRACTFLSVTLPAHGLFNPQLHAVWHVLVSCGFYALLLVIAHERLVALGRAPRLERVGGLLPRLRAG
ncbi:ceramidase [Aggregicoccus sp. 17bor-14]|uniref:ceramidase n=1 Tax=Myxococcaceae TaxID=31 RepID=UPI00129C6D04|nr:MULTISPECIES: ceramidase [Myxococcaceae]MBF5043457.1 ceramidase [Simulacricoccus sp. 17bor-14]MRI89215.1 ceramidase [Aggregicoccus sp. 17bor-14]